MANAVIMPRQGQSVESCIIGKWHKQEGDAVKEGDILFTYETDKATFDETAKQDGTLIAVFFEEGDDVPCLMNVCVIGEPGEDVSEFDPRDAQETEEESAEDVSASAAAVTETATAPSQTEAAAVAAAVAAVAVYCVSSAVIRIRAGDGLG